MDAYLQIAQRVLRAAKCPLTPREILRRGFATGEVSTRLHGKTQHKTLQARLSEDILQQRNRSAFFRTQPGYFFLREFLADQTIPAKFRVPIIARRRQRELARPDALAFDAALIEDRCARNPTIERHSILKLIAERKYHYAKSSTSRLPNETVVWAFILVLRDGLVLTYRNGRYREDRDTFLQKRSIGFFTPVVQNDLTLFDQIDHGIVASGMRTLNIDLDLNSYIAIEDSAELDCFVCTKEASGPKNLLAVVRFRCPDWFEPLTRRLAINDLRWQDLSAPVNYLEDFDPWSQLVLTCTRPVRENHEVKKTNIYR